MFLLWRWSVAVSETKQDTVELRGMEAFLCPLFLVCKEQTPASMTFPEFQRAGLNSPNQGRQRVQRHGRSSQEATVQPRGRGLVPPQGIHGAVVLSSFRNENPKQMEDVSILPSREDQSMITSRSSSREHLRTDERHPEAYQGTS